jgi:predicted TIM-barrel fold metal-dependent hydrolase
MAERGRRKTSPEQWAEWKRNEDRFAEILQRRLEQLGLTREELDRRAHESLRKTLEG